MMNGEMTIQEVARATGLSSHTLRYYERAGLIEPIARNRGGHRRYRRRDVDILLFLNRLRMAGMPIRQVRRYVQLCRVGPETVDDRKVLLEVHRDGLLARIAELQRCLGAVEYKIGLYGGGWSFTTSSDPCMDKLRSLCLPSQDREGAIQ